VAGLSAHLLRLRGVWGKAQGHEEAGLAPGRLGYNGTVGWRERITFDPQVMGGRPCIRGMRITVGTILTLLRHQTPEEILRDYPYLEREDIDAALEYAAHLADEREVAV
jgi:uncharacterized protein (DUF433 family)